MRNILLSPSVKKGQKIAYLFCSEDGWVAISKKDKENLYIEEEFNVSKFEEFGILTEEQLYDRIPILRGQLDEGEQKFITIDYDNGRVYVNPKHKLKSIFTDTSARATNQANFQTNTWTYITNRKSHYTKVVIVAILLLILSLAVSWGIYNLLFWFLFYEYFSTLGSIDNYKIGTLNASLVVTEKPTRIAVLTDVSMGFGKYPLVRICKMKLPKRYNRLNAKIPSSCGYQTCYNQKFWDFVMPNPLVYATNDDLAITKKINEIPTKDWVVLKNWIRSNQDSLFEGYYPIIEDKNDWSDSQNLRFVSFNEEKKSEHNTV